MHSRPQDTSPVEQPLCSEGGERAGDGGTRGLSLAAPAWLWRAVYTQTNDKVITCHSCPLIKPAPRGPGEDAALLALFEFLHKSENFKNMNFILLKCRCRILTGISYILILKNIFPFPCWSPTVKLVIWSLLPCLL